ncbi:MAG: hypothetical protein ACW98F_03465 [Candidatus Hodarchaeales archaeon]
MFQLDLFVILVTLYLCAYLWAIFGGAIFVGRFLSPYKDPDSTKKTMGLSGAGRKIGQVERAIILTLALMGEFGTISFVFVAKSMARFEQLKERHFAEYYLLGTLLSIFFALATAILVQGIITLITVTLLPDLQNLWGS